MKKCYHCSVGYHELCFSHRGVTKENRNYCFDCYYLNFNQQKKDESKMITNRDFYETTVSQDLFIPQIGESVYFIYEAYEAFVSEAFNNFNFEVIKQTQTDFKTLPHLFFPQLLKPCLCKIREMHFVFPIQNKKNFQEKKDEYGTSIF